MSYVIQNFYDCNRKLAFTPRFFYLFIFANLEKIIIFIKFNTFFFFTNKQQLMNFNYFFLFTKYFFSRQFIKILFKMNLKLVGGYENNLTKCSIYHIFNTINTFIDSKAIISNRQFNDDTYFFNQYLLPIKVLNIKLRKKFFKNTFFYFMFINSYYWWQKSTNFKFYLNFLFINYNFKVYPFFSGYFLRVYSF